MTPTTNLAARPFRNERLPWLFAGLLLGLAIIVSLAHGRLISRLLSGAEANTVRAVREDEARIAELEAGIALEPPLKLESAELARLKALKAIVDRRVFPWRRLLADLEGALSEDVRLISILPSTARDVKGMVIELTGEARSKDAAFSLAEALDASPVFSNAVLRSLSERNDLTAFAIQVDFDPESSLRLAAAAAAPAEAPSPIPATVTPLAGGAK